MIKAKIRIDITGGVVEVTADRDIDLIQLDWDTNGCDPKTDDVLKTRHGLAWVSVGNADVVGNLDDEFEYYSKLRKGGGTRKA